MLSEATLCQVEVFPVTAFSPSLALPKSMLSKPPRCAAHAFSNSITHSSGPWAEMSPYWA